MDPWVADLVKDTARIVLGWALGLGSALLVDWWKNKRKIGATKIAGGADIAFYVGDR